MKIDFFKHGDFGRGFGIGCRWQRCYGYPDNPKYASQLHFHIRFWKWVFGMGIHFKEWKKDEKYK